jgi:hypothetical protein
LYASCCYLVKSGCVFVPFLPPLSGLQLAALIKVTEVGVGLCCGVDKEKFATFYGVMPLLCLQPALVVLPVM